MIVQFYDKQKRINISYELVVFLNYYKIGTII